MEQEKNEVTKKRTLMDGLRDAAAAPVFLHDRIQGSIDRAFMRMVYGIAASSHNLRLRYKGSGRQMLSVVFALILMTCGLLLIFDHFTLYEYSYNGRVLGYVDNQENVTTILDVAGQQLSGAKNAEIDFKVNENVTFRKVPSFNLDTDNADQVLNKLTYMTDIEVEGSGIYEDGVLLAVVKSEDAAENVLDAVLDYYREPDDGMVVTSIGFKNDVEIKPVSVMLTSIQSEKKAAKTLRKGGDTRFQHIMMENEGAEELREIYSLSKNYVIKDDRHEYLNNIYAGDLIAVENHVSAIQVEMVEKGTRTETIEFEKKKERTKDLYIGEKEIKQEGRNGRMRMTGTVTKVNGVDVERVADKEETILAPVDEITLVGTTIKPKTAPTGTFAMPIHTYTITSYFGYRWGRNHDGIDFGAPTGTTIFASDGGEVIRSGYYGGYGLCMEVLHDNGTYTRYGHCSATYVNVGDKVFQGQEIGAVGSTGFSTGPHLHFEIHPNGGGAVDPLPYLPLN